MGGLNLTELAVLVTALGAIVTPIMIKYMDVRQASRAAAAAEGLKEVKTTLEVTTEKADKKQDVIHELVNSRLTRALDANKLLADFIVKKYPGDEDAKEIVRKHTEGV